MGVKERKEREKNLRREAILEAAKDLFQQKGFMDVSMSEVAERVELGTGTLYLYFKSKDDILGALALIGSEKIDALIDDIIHERDQISKRHIADFIRGFIRIYMEYSFYIDALIYTYKGSHNVNLSEPTIESIKSLTLSSIMKVLNYFASKAPGKANALQSAKAETFAFWAMLMGLTQLVDLGRRELLTDEDVDKIIDKAADLIYHTIM